MRQTEVAERMRENININVINTEINDPRSGRTGEMAVAFSIRFDYPHPDDARRVTNQLASLYLSTNLEMRRRVAEETTNFLVSERQDAEARIDEIEEEIAVFQSRNQEYLPEEIDFKRRILANVEQQLQDLGRELRSLREREGFLTTELALTDEFLPAEEGRRAIDTPEAQLERARAELATAKARYSDTHPDIGRLEREVRSLQAVVGDRRDVGALVASGERLAAELAKLRERYTSEHPDVRRVRRELEGIREALAATDGTGGSVESGRQRRNSAYVQLSAQLNSIRTEINAIEEQREELKAERVELQEQLARAPIVEREYTRLNRALENAVADLEALADKEATASLSGSLEAEAISERLVIVEPPTTPLEPVSPQEKLILALGLVLAVGSSGAAVFAAEYLDRSVRSPAQLSRLVGDMPLVAIPNIVGAGDRRFAWAVRLGVVVVVVALVGGVALWIHRTVVPLDLLVAQVMVTMERWF